MKHQLLELQHAKELRRLQDENRLLNHELEKALERLDRRHRAVVPQGPMPIRVHEGDFTRVFCCDVHGAKMHTGAAGAFLSDMKILQPNEIILGGDIVDVGGFLALHHVLGYVAETSYSYDDDIAAGGRFIDQLQKNCPKAHITYLEGNHENRVERWALTQTLRHPKDAEGLRKRNAPEFLLHLAERGIPYIRMSQYYDGLSVQGTIRRGKCFYTHGSFLTSKNAARDAVNKFSGNVVFGNTHRRDDYVGHRPNVGVLGGYNPGCLCELQPVWRNTDPTDWTHGYAVQFVTKGNGEFLHINIPIVNSKSLLVPFLNQVQ